MCNGEPCPALPRRQTSGDTMHASGSGRIQQRLKIEEIGYDVGGVWLCRARRTGLRARFVAQHRLDGPPSEAQELGVICHDDQPHAGLRPLAAKGTSEASRIHRSEDVRGVWGPKTLPPGIREQNFSCAYACRPISARETRRRP